MRTGRLLWILLLHTTDTTCDAGDHLGAVFSITVLYIYTDTHTWLQIRRVGCDRVFHASTRLAVSHV